MSSLPPKNMVEPLALQDLLQHKMSELEDSFAVWLRLEGLPCPAREYRFASLRRWRFDFAWIAEKVAVEIDGGLWLGGATSNGRRLPERL